MSVRLGVFLCVCMFPRKRIAMQLRMNSRMFIVRASAQAGAHVRFFFLFLE